MSEKYIVGEPVDGRGFWAVLDRYSKVRCSPRFTEKTEAEAHLAEMLRDEQADTEGARTMPTTLTYSSDRFQVFRNDTTGEFELIALTDAQPSVKVRGHDATVLRDSLADIAAAGKLADGYLAAYFPAEQAATDEPVARRSGSFLESGKDKLTVAEYGDLRAEIREEARADVIAEVLARVSEIWPIAWQQANPEKTVLAAIRKLGES